MVGAQSVTCTSARLSVPRACAGTSPPLSQPATCTPPSHTSCFWPRSDDNTSASETADPSEDDVCAPTWVVSLDDVRIPSLLRGPSLVARPAVVWPCHNALLVNERKTTQHPSESHEHVASTIRGGFAPAEKRMSRSSHRPCDFSAAITSPIISSVWVTMPGRMRRGPSGRCGSGTDDRSLGGERLASLRGTRRKQRELTEV